jgi:hypothetical protein
MKASILLTLALHALVLPAPASHAPPLTDQDIIGYWDGVNPGPNYNLEFQAYYSPEHAWEFRRLEAMDIGLIYHEQKIGKWKIGGDSLYTKAEIAKTLEATSGDTCCAYPGDFFGDHTEIYSEGGARKMRFIFLAGRRLDTAYFAYVSPHPAFTFRDLAGPTGIRRPGAQGPAARERRGHLPAAFRFRRSEYRVDGTLLPR